MNWCGVNMLWTKKLRKPMLKICSWIKTSNSFWIRIGGFWSCRSSWGRSGPRLLNWGRRLRRLIHIMSKKWINLKRRIRLSFNNYELWLMNIEFKCQNWKKSPKIIIRSKMTPERLDWHNWRARLSCSILILRECRMSRFNWININHSRFWTMYRKLK